MLDSKRIKVFLMFLIVIFCGQAWANENTYKELLSAKSLKCTFGPGTFGDWDGGEFTLVRDIYGQSVNYDAIDLKKGTARVIGPTGASDLVVTYGTYGLTFTESFVTGIAITTVFPEYKKGTKDFIAVLSRHVGVIGSPLPSQYHGTCVVMQ